MDKDVMRPAGATARLGSTLHVKGEISGNEDVYIDGTVEGLVHLGERKLTVGAVAKLAPDVIAGEVIVHGSVKGNVRGKRTIEIKKDGSVNGDLTTAQSSSKTVHTSRARSRSKGARKRKTTKMCSRGTASAPAMPTRGAGPKSI